MFETTYLRTRGPMYFVETTQIVPTNKSTFTVTVMQFIVIFFSFFLGGGRRGGLIDCLMVNVFVLSTVDRGLEPRSGQTKSYRICICSFFPEHAALMSKN